MIRPDPPVRADGRCYVCQKPRNPDRSRRYAGGAAELDPFDSNECARVFHGCPLPPVGSGPGARKPVEA